MSSSPGGPEERVLVWMPAGQDARRTCALLAEAGMVGVACADFDVLGREYAAGAGAILLADEAGDGFARLSVSFLDSQPSWSDIPLVVLAREGAHHAAFREAANVTLVERPVRMRSLLSVVRASLRARRRQYEVRDLLAERQRAAEAMRAERERYRVTLASIGDAVIATDAAGLVTFLNPAAEGLTGWPTAEAAGRPLPEVFRIVNETTRAEVESPAQRALANGVVVGLANHTVLIARDGRERPIDDSAAPIRDEAGGVVGAVLVFRDITERKQAEEDLRTSESRYRTIVEATPECVKLVAPDGTLLQMNPAGLAMVEGDESALGQCVYNVVAAEDRDRFRAFNERICRGGRGTLEFDIIGLKGTRRHMETTAVPLPTAQGGFTQLAVTRDVTARRLAEAAVRERDERLQLFLGNATDYALIISDADDRALEWLGGAEQITGWHAEEAIGQPLEIIFTPEDRAAGVPQAETAKAAETGGRAENTRWHMRRDGSKFFAEGVTVSIRGPVGELRGFGKVFRDATAKKRAEDALKDADRKKDDFIALLAHELRNPLAPVRNGLQVLRLSQDRTTRERAQAMMDRQLAHMVRLIDDLLDVSRIGRNKMELRRGRVSLADVVSSAVETARPVLEEAGHELHLSLPPRPVFLDADLTRLSQVFGNLLANSAKYTARGGKVWLSAERRGGAVEVTVRDNGIGIPAEALPTIFDMFSQVDRSIERSTGGLGIGLALVKGLAEMHGGTVTAESGGEGLGSRFTVTLPTLSDGPGEAPQGASDGRVARGPKRHVLVVDDNRDGAESLATMLELLGNRVAMAHDGLEAVEAAGRFRPEVILMDVGMPRLNGLDATRRIREAPWGKAVTIIALTGWGQENDRERSREAGCDGHLVKPVHLPDLQKLLEELRGSKVE